MIMIHTLTETFKFETIFRDTSKETIENMITNWDDVKRVTETSIIWNSNVQWISQVYENLGYQMFPRREWLGQGHRPYNYTLG